MPRIISQDLDQRETAISQPGVGEKDHIGLAIRRERQGRDKSEFQIIGQLIHGDGLGPNANNFYDNISDQRRQDILLLVLADILCQ